MSGWVTPKKMEQILNSFKFIFIYFNWILLFQLFYDCDNMSNELLGGSMLDDVWCNACFALDVASCTHGFQLWEDPNHQKVLLLRTSSKSQCLHNSASYYAAKHGWLVLAYVTTLTPKIYQIHGFILEPLLSAFPSVQHDLEVFGRIFALAVAAGGWYMRLFVPETLGEWSQRGASYQEFC